MPLLHFVATYSFFANGLLQVSLGANLRDELNTFLPRLGFEFPIAADNEEFTYFGRGKLENYCDMNRHTLVGLYRSTADKEYVPYVMPQEHGTHTQVNYLETQSGGDVYVGYGI